ncbi:hypothetical protein BGW80DRAFT_1312706 [Lactifluus volemus]|nr:hypothetical protein BGW80DRAFT_1312706 [Lactifluus volemus]
MFATLFFATLLSFSLFFTVVTPQFTQCASAHFNWTDTGKGPYTVAIVNTSNPCGDAVFDLGDHQGTSMTWKVTIPCGWDVTIWVGDADDGEAWSGNIEVGSSDDHSCLPQALLSDSNNNNAASEYVNNSSPLHVFLLLSH